MRLKGQFYFSHYIFPNLEMRAGLAKMAAILAGGAHEAKTIKLGNGTAAPDEDQLNLTGTILATVAGTASVSGSTLRINGNYTAGSSVTLTEIGTFFGATMIARALMPQVEVVVGKQYPITWQLPLEN